MSRVERVACWWFTAAIVTLLAAMGVIAGVTHSLLSLLLLVPFVCVLVGCFCLDEAHYGNPRSQP